MRFHGGAIRLFGRCRFKHQTTVSSKGH